MKTLTVLALFLLLISAIVLPASPCFGQSIEIVSPQPRAIFQQTDESADIPAAVSASGVPLGGTVLFVLDEGTVDEVEITSSSPYDGTFADVPLGEHTIDAYIVNSSGVRVAWDSVERVGVGEIIVAIGDSVTAGLGDDVYTDNWSADGRSGPYVNPSTGEEYGGFEPILSDMLTAEFGYPHCVINEGIPGDRTYDGIQRVPSVLARHPNARIWLIAYGTNDANSGISSTTFKANLQRMVDQLHAAIPYAQVYFPKMLYTPKSVIPSYHGCMGDLIRNNQNCYWGADLETLFHANHTLYDHLTRQTGTWLATTTTHHPNGIGVQVIAQLWKLALVDRAILVTDGVLPTLGTLWADKTYISGVNTIGLGVP